MISKLLKKRIKLTYNTDGYVLDFSNDGFNDFTEESIGKRIQEELNNQCGRYVYSKGKAFNHFIENASDYEIYKLVNDLHDHLFLLTQYGQSNTYLDEQYSRSSEIIEDLKMEYKDFKLNPLSDDIKVYFNNEVVSRQIELMIDEIYTSPTNAIGKAKNLLETCFKYVIKETGHNYTSTDDLMDLRKKASKAINLDVNENTSAKTNKTIKKILSSLTQITEGINMLRNDYGDGHGIDKEFVELPPRYARLVVSSAITIVEFYLSTLKYNKKLEGNENNSNI